MLYKLKQWIRFLQDWIKVKDNKATKVYLVLRFLVILTAVRSIFTGDYESLFLCILSLALFLVPAFLEGAFKMNIPPLFEIIIYLFIYAAEILGEVNRFYTTIPGWDTMLHTLNGFLCAVIGFSLVDLLNRNSKAMNLSPFYLALAAFCFSMTIGVIWEFFEFTMDQIFHLDMQKDFVVQTISSVTLDPNQTQVPFQIRDIARTLVITAAGETHEISGGYLDIGIIDTMKDLLVNFIGAVVFSVIGFFYVSNREKPSRIASDLVIRASSDEEIASQTQEIRNLEKSRREKKRARKNKDA